MRPEVLAGVSALLFAGSHIASRRGVQDTSVISGLLISLVSGWLVLLVAVVTDPPGEISLAAFWILVGSGAAAPAVGRAGAITGVARLGPSVSVPIQASVYPLFAVTAAFLFLGEAAGVSRIVGVVAIVIGVWVLAGRGAEPCAPDLDAAPDGRPTAALRTPAFAFPVLAGLAYGGGDVIRKQALEQQHDPTFGAMVAVGTAAVLWMLATALLPQVRARLRAGPQARWFALSGVLTSLAVLSQFHALNRGEVSVVSPIVAAQPLAVFALSALFLKGLERVTSATFVGSIAIVAGTIMVSD